MKLKFSLSIWAVVAALCLCGASLLAQDDNAGGPGGPGGGGPDGPPNAAGGSGGRFDPVQFQQRMMRHIRQDLNVTNDNEWSVIQPLVQKVMDTRREADMGMGGGPGGFGPGGPGGPQSAVERQTLQKALASKAPVAEVKDALDKFRTARKDKQDKLEAAQANLKSVLTTKQEAQAVLLGLLR
jgi:hypothetical protein